MVLSYLFFSGFAKDFYSLAKTSVILLTILVCCKLTVTSYLVTKNTYKSNWFSLFAVVSLAFVMPVMSYYTKEQYPIQILVNNIHIYLGNIAPNQWHNSTLILAMPFYLLLFYFAISKIDSSKINDILIIALCSAVSVTCKPNFVLAFLPVFSFGYFFINYTKFNLYIKLRNLIMIILPTVFILAIQWYFTFKSNNLFSHPNKTIINPFLVWRLYSPHLFISFILSICFPLIILCFYIHKFDKFIIFAWFTFLLALLMIIFLAEYPGYPAGNYFWGAIASNYILFLYSVATLLKQKVDYKFYICSFIFMLHLFSGLYLLYSFFINQTSLIM